MPVLGRTNQTFPRIWLSLSLPRQADESERERMVRAALEGGVPVDVSSQPALWGGHLRASTNHPDATVVAIGGHAMENATDEKHSADLVQSQIIETLCGIGRETVDFYFLRVRRAVEEYQISGALQALESAKQEGHIRFLGLCCDGSPLATLGLWQFHDAFEVLLLPRNHQNSSAYGMLSPMARERRVGIVGYRPLNWGHGLPFAELGGLWRLRNLTQSFYGLTLAQAALHDLSREHPVMVGVRSEEEVRQALAVPNLSPPEGLEAMLEPFREAFADDAAWADLVEDERPWVREAARRRHDARRV